MRYSLLFLFSYLIILMLLHLIGFLDSCLEGFFSCTSNGQCILKNRTCNSIQDCADNSDEKLDAGCGMIIYWSYFSFVNMFSYLTIFFIFLFFNEPCFFFLFIYFLLFFFSFYSFSFFFFFVFYLSFVY